MDRNFIYQRVPRDGGGVCHVFLVGTAHSTQQSCTRVRHVIDIIKPQTVMLDMCGERYTEMLSEETFQAPTWTSFFHTWIKGEKTLIDFLYCWYLMKRGGTKMLLGQSEYKAAYEAANETGAQVVPGEFPMKTTIDKVWARMSIVEKVNVACELLFKIFIYPIPEADNEFKGIDDEDIELLNSFPPSYDTLVEQRNRYMAYYLWEEASKCSSLVAVLERTHLKGVPRYWRTAFMKLVGLNEVPTVTEQRPPTVNMFVSLGVVIVTSIGIGIYLWRKN